MITPREKIDPNLIKEGDWIRFYNGGKPVIAVVQYLPYRAGSGVYVDTDLCPVSIDLILEHRPKPT